MQLIKEICLSINPCIFYADLTIQRFDHCSSQFIDWFTWWVPDFTFIIHIACEYMTITGFVQKCVQLQSAVIIWRTCPGNMTRTHNHKIVIGSTFYCTTSSCCLLHMSLLARWTTSGFLMSSNTWLHFSSGKAELFLLLIITIFFIKTSLFLTVTKDSRRIPLKET